MSNYPEAQQQIMNAIRPRTFPLAVKFLQDGEKFPDKARRPSVVLNKRVTICQAVTMARVYGWSVAVAREDIICVPALIAWGLSGAENPEEELSGLFETVGFGQNREIAASQVKALTRPTAGEISGILLSPLAKSQLEPDTVVVYCNPAQAMRLVQAVNYFDGGPVRGGFGGKVECLETLYAAHRLNEPRVSIPGMGDRVFSMTQDDELAVSLPAKNLPRLLKGLDEAARKIGARYPITFYQNFEPQFPPAYQELAARLKLFAD